MNKLILISFVVLGIVCISQAFPQPVEGIQVAPADDLETAQQFYGGYGGHRGGYGGYGGGYGNRWGGHGGNRWGGHGGNRWGGHGGNRWGGHGGNRWGGGHYYG